MTSKKEDAEVVNKECYASDDKDAYAFVSLIA